MKLFLSYNKFFLICIFLILRVDISFSFDEEALINRKLQDDTIERTGQRFLDRL